METLDREWLRKRLGDERGQQAALAKALGVRRDYISKILSGERRIQASEVVPLLRFFGEELSSDVPDGLRAIMDAYRHLSPEDQAYLAKTAQLLGVLAERAQRPATEEQPDTPEEVPAPQPRNRR